jgi:beta-lactamase superfamily II metal-dependent hydrolase
VTQANKTLLFLVIFAAIALFAAGKIPVPKADEVATNQLQVAHLDIGQGDSILLTTPHREHILIDGGPDATVLTRLGEEMRFTERTIDLMIATHNDADHITGLNEVMRRYTVKQLWINGAIHTTNEYLELLQNIKDHNIPTEVVWKGKSTNVDGVQLDVLWPAESAQGVRPQEQNAVAIVTKATYGQRKFLFTADIAEEQEQAMLEAGEDVSADVLKEAHHGSKYGLLPAFLDAVNPTYAVIQVGAKNKFGHPAPSTLAKLKDHGVQIFRNDQQGTIHVITDGTNLSVRAQK